jgi:hypothetical protein
MPRKRRAAPKKGTVDGAIAAVVDAKAHASGRAWSLLHRTESMLTLAAGKRRASTHARKAAKKKKKKAKKA